MYASQSSVLYDTATSVECVDKIYDTGFYELNADCKGKAFVL